MNVIIVHHKRAPECTIVFCHLYCHRQLHFSNETYRLPVNSLYAFDFK